MIRLFAVDVSPLREESCYVECYRRSSEERRKKADALKIHDDKVRCIAAGLLLPYAYKNYRLEYMKELARANSFGYDENSDIRDRNAAMEEVLPLMLPVIEIGADGKPYFAHMQEQGYVQLYFNLSHSGDYVICALSDVPVGVDIQKTDVVREKVRQRFFSEEEKQRLEDCGQDESLRQMIFSGIWAQKEARAKLTGRGIGQILAGEREAIEMQKMHVSDGVIGESYPWAVARFGDEVETERVILLLVDGGELFYG